MDTVTAAGFECEVVDDHGRARILLRGEIDMAASEAIGAAAVAASTRSDRVVVDLSEVTFIDGTGLDALMRIADIAVAQGVVIGFAHRPPIVDRVLDLTSSTLAPVCSQTSQ